MRLRVPYLLTAVAPGLLLWEIVGRLNVTFILPPVSSVIAKGLQVWSSEAFLSSLGGSLTSLLVGFVTASAAGMAIGLLMGRFEPVSWALDPYVNVLMSSPKAALIPVIVLFFGFGRTAVVLTVFLYSFFPVVVNTAAGVRQTPLNMIEMAHAFGASEWAIARRVMLPAAAPLILGGLRFAAARSIKGLVIGEQLISVVGIGAMIQRYGVEFMFPELYSIVLLVAFAGLTLAGMFRWAERAVTPWATTATLQRGFAE